MENELENEAEFNKLAQDVITEATNRRATKILDDWENEKIIRIKRK